MNYFYVNCAILLSKLLQKSQNEVYLSMLKQVLDTPHYYFSYTYDLTHTLQRLHSMPPEFLRLGLYERADNRFVWNGNLLKHFKKSDAKKYCLPLVLGCKFISNLINKIS